MSYLAKPLAFPDYTKFSELFEAHSFDKGKLKAERWTFADYSLLSDRREITTINIGPYCHGRAPDGGFFSLDVQPTRELIDFIKANMLPAGPRDAITFEIVVRRSETGDHEALIIASNSAIIGSRWLALVDASTVPFPPEESCPETSL